MLKFISPILFVIVLGVGFYISAFGAGSAEGISTVEPGEAEAASGIASEITQEITQEITREWVVATIGLFIVFIPIAILLTIPMAKPLGLRGSSWLSLLVSALPFAQIGLLAVFLMKIPPGFDLKLNLIFIVPSVVVSLIAAPFAVYINNRG